MKASWIRVSLPHRYGQNPTTKKEKKDNRDDHVCVEDVEGPKVCSKFANFFSSPWKKNGQLSSQFVSQWQSQKFSNKLRIRSKKVPRIHAKRMKTTIPAGGTSFSLSK